MNQTRRPVAARKWAYTWSDSRTPYLHQFYTPAQWQAANIKRQIADITARIRDGASWLQTMPSTDPNRAKYQARINALKLHRVLLTVKLKKLASD